MQHTKESHVTLAVQATTHCLIGCGIGEVIGVIIGTVLGLPYTSRIITGVLLGFVFGFLLGILPLVRSKMTYRQAAKIVLTTETFSILAMEAAEAITELLFPGMKKAGLIHLTYWLGLASALAAGFIVAFPINLLLVKKGIRHHH
jgi:energy-converting hydrogenase Eha subunit A